MNKGTPLLIIASAMGIWMVACATLSTVTRGRRPDGASLTTGASLRFRWAGPIGALIILGTGIVLHAAGWY